MIARALLLMLCLLFSLSALSAPSWTEWRNTLRTEALQQGVRPSIFDMAFQGVHPVERVVKLDRNQPEDRLTFTKYRATRIDAFRIRLGVSQYKKYRSKLEKIGKKYRVDPCIITALWGIESSYGHFKGSFPVISSLATLAYDGRRSDFFRNELLLALQILNGQHITLKEFKGEWAGASGHSQFLPSSWHKFAVDYDGDGKKDIWNNLGDVFASIANYLKGHGWESNQPWGLEVNLPAGFDRSLLKSEPMFLLSQWVALGVTAKPGFSFPKNNLESNLVQLYGSPVFLVFKNYYVLKKYNQSGFYAASVGFLAENICKKVR